MPTGANFLVAPDAQTVDAKLGRQSLPRGRTSHLDTYVICGCPGIPYGATGRGKGFSCWSTAFARRRSPASDLLMPARAGTQAAELPDTLSFLR